MEPKKLDFNRPVLSVRRFGPTAAETENKARTDIAQNNFPAVPFYKADLKSGPLRNPGTIPFVWEQTPGRPKHERKSIYQNSELPPIAPRLPPGNRRDANEKLEPVRSQNRLTTDVSRSTNLNTSHKSVNPSDVKTVKLGSTQEGRSETEIVSSEDDDDAYVDARDTLSRSESFFDNCSLSGLSGLDGSDAILTGIVSADPQMVDFMMGRFLPAAKAMASEAPPHSSKKMYALNEQPKQAKGAVNAAKRNSTPDIKSNLLRHYIQNDIEEDREEDMDDEDYQSIIASKGCGFLPRFCLLSPVPGLRILPQTRARSVRRVPANSFKTAHRTKCVTKISSAADHTTTENLEEMSNPSIESASTRDESFHCTSHDEKQFAGTCSESKPAKNFASGPEAFRTFQVFLMDQNADHESPPESPMVEKTLYIDSGHGTRQSETPSSLAVTEDSKRNTENCEQFHDKIDISADSPSRGSSLQEIEHLSIADENKAVKAVIMGPFDTVESQAIVSHQNSKFVTGGEGGFSDKGVTTSEDSNVFQDRDIKNQQLHLVSSNKTPTGCAYHQLPLPPPLPNSPSDSWLCRALPRNQTKSYHGSPMQVYSKPRALKQNHVDPKWETMVKTSKPQRRHHRYSQEMLTSIPEA
ncbi:hypothetical protein QQ045_015520 [Rhodiola kirilowii]